MRVLLLALLCVAAQQAPVFRTGIDYVTVDVVVTDGSDVPISNLTKDDFELIDRGRPQVVADFQYVSVPVMTRTVDVKAPRPPAPDVATNIPASPDSRLFVMVIDDLHIIESEIVAVKKVMIDFIAALSPDDEVAMVFVGRSDLSLNFTRDTGRLLRAVDRVRDALGLGLDALAIVPGVDPDTFRSDPMTLGHARSAAFVLRNVAASLAGSTHRRRAVVFVSGGTPLDPTPNATNAIKIDTVALGILFDELNATFEAARRAGVPIYTLDPRGLASPDTAVRGSITNAGTAAAARLALRIQRDRLSELAINSGGRAFVGQSDLTRAVREIVRENGSYYVLGFYPNPVDRDGKFHEIEVKVKRPGVRVRARHGYVAPAPGPVTADTKPALDAAMSAGVNVSGLSLSAIVAPLAASAKGMTSAVTIEVTYPAPAEGTRRISDDLRISVIAVDADGKVKATVEQNRSFSVMASDGQTALTFFIDDAIELPPQPLTIRVGVASRALGRTGTVHLPVEVPEPFEGRLQISALALTSDDQPRIGVMSADLIADLVPFQPVLTRTFALSDTLRVFGRLFWESRDPAVAVSVAVASARSEVRSPSLALTGTVTSGNRRQAELDTTLRLAELAPGVYVLRVVATLQNGQTAIRELPVTVK